MATRAMLASWILITGLMAWGPAIADGDHASDANAAPDAPATIEDLRALHSEHAHEHDFEAIEALTPEEMQKVLEAMTDIGLVAPPMDSHRGREIFLERGCIACHQVNGVGGVIGPSLDAADMPTPMNVFEFAARMWGGASAMIQLQEDLFGGQIELTGQDLADLIAFAHDAAEQSEVTLADVPEEFRAFIDE